MSSTETASPKPLCRTLVNCTLRKSSDSPAHRNEVIRVSAPAAFKLPNVRRLFIPDKGYMLYEADLSAAQTVRSSLGKPTTKELKRWLRDGTDMHVRHGIEVGRDTRDRQALP